MDFQEYAKGWGKFADGFEDMLVKQIHENKILFEEFVTE